VVLDDANSAIAGGLTIASGATLQIGNNDANGILPSGALDDEGTLIFKRSNNLLVGVNIPGAGALAQSGSGTLFLSVSNTYTGNTTVTAGTLVLTNSGSIVNSAQVNVTGATLDISGISGITTLTTLNLNNTSLKLAAGYPQPNLYVNSLNLGGTGNTINVTALPPIASYPTTLTVIQSASAISGFNFSVGTLPAGYGGTVGLSGDTTAVLLTLTSGPTNTRPSVTWSGVDALNNVSTNWSDNLNWQLPGAPVTVDNVIFNNTATSANGSDLSTAGGGASALTPAYINNFVDSNFTVASLTFTNNGGSYHNTGITNGATLNVTNSFTVGALDTGSPAQQQYVNFAGGGGATLNVNNTNANLQIWLGSRSAVFSQATLDLSALDNFTGSLSRLTVGAPSANINRPGGVLYLAKTNTITAAFQATSVESGSTTANSAIVVGDCNQNPGSTSYLYLGQVNTISADTFGIARQKTSANLQFNPIYANVAPYPTVTFKGFSSSLVSIFDIGDGLGNSGTTTGTGDLNLNGGQVTAVIDTLNIGRSANANSTTTILGTTTGTLEFDDGTITVNTANLGLESITNSKVGVGTITVGTNSIIGAGANLVVNGNLNLGVNPGGAGAVTTSGTLDIYGGTVRASSIVAGTNGATSTINLTAGTLIVSNTAGTTAAPLTTLALTGGTLQLNVNGGANLTNIVTTGITTSGTTILKIGSLTGVATGVTYPLISYTGTDPYGSLSLVLPSGYTGSLADNSGIVGLTLTVVPPSSPPHITGISVTGTTLNISATNGASSGQFVLLGTTNVAKPLSQWTRLLTNNFNASGDLNLSTNIINPAVPQEFYIISQ